MPFIIAQARQNVKYFDQRKNEREVKQNDKNTTNDLDVARLDISGNQEAHTQR